MAILKKIYNNNLFTILHILNFKFNQAGFHKFLIKWIITTENVHFRHMIKMLNLDALVPTADTIKNDIMESFNEEYKKRKDLFQVSLYFFNK